MKDSLVKHVDNHFCSYEPKNNSFYSLFGNPFVDENDFESYVPADISCIVDEYGELEELCDELGIDNNNYMARNVRNHIDKLNKLIDNIIYQILEERLERLEVVYMSEEDKKEHVYEIKRNFIKELESNGD